MTTTTSTEGGHMGELVRYFLRLGCLGFGGPVALVGQMERELVHAKSQKAAMDRAKVKLADAAVKSMGQAKGQQAGNVLVVSAVPELKDDRPEAAIVLLAGKQFTTVSEHLD